MDRYGVEEGGAEDRARGPGCGDRPVATEAGGRKPEAVLYKLSFMVKTFNE